MLDAQTVPAEVTAADLPGPYLEQHSESDEEANVMLVLPLDHNAETTLERLPLAQLFVAGNYRSQVDSAGLQELAESIKHSGLLQPVLTRPLAEPREGFTHELVAGFRREAAHELAGLTTILATVRPMSDDEVEEYRVLENLQRENPHPLDEAKAVAAMQRVGRNVLEIANRLGKSPKWVVQRRALNELLPAWVECLRKDKLSLAAAEELARWPQDVQQRLFEPAKHWGNVELDSVQRWLKNEQRQLKTAAWSLEDAALVPSAGACTTCPKRSSCATMLFAEIDGTDTCLDGDCWTVKLSAHIEQTVTELKAAHNTETVYRISSLGWGGPSGSLPTHKYETTKRKKDSFAAVLVDGPYAGKVRRITLVGAVRTSATEPTPQKSRGEVMKENRYNKLMLFKRKELAVGRVQAILQGAPEQATPMVGALLTLLVAEQLKRVRSSSVDAMLFDQLATEWNWQPEPHDWQGQQTWVKEQIAACAPTNEKLLELLLFVRVRQELADEFHNYQVELLQKLGQPELLADLDTEATEKISLSHDPLTWKPRKAA